MAKPKIKREPSNALTSSHGMWTQVVPQCHPAAQWHIVHSTFHGIYEIQCGQCGQNYLRVETGKDR